MAFSVLKVWSGDPLECTNTPNQNFTEVHIYSKREAARSPKERVLSLPTELPGSGHQNQSSGNWAPSPSPAICTREPWFPAPQVRPAKQSATQPQGKQNPAVMPDLTANKTQEHEDTGTRNYLLELAMQGKGSHKIFLIFLSCT